jgi:ABC-type sugar transport system substrate-binding protein
MEETMNLTRRILLVGTCIAGALTTIPTYVLAEDSKQVAVMFDSLQSPFWVTGLEVLKEKLKVAGYEPVESISNLDDSKQFEQVQSMIQKKVAGIIIVQTDSKAVIPAIREANKAGIPMVHFNRPPADSDAVSSAVQADNRAIMKSTVQALVDKARKAGGKYKAAILIGDLGDANAIQRRDGFFDVVDANKDIIEVVSQIATQWNADKAFSDLTNALQAHPDINMLVTSSDFLIPQIQQALKTAGKWKKTGEEGHVLFAGFDGDEGGYKALADGYMDVEGVQNLFFEADLAIDAIKKIKAGEKLPKLLLDPGFVLLQDKLQADREKSWGYAVWKKKNGG